jgi:anti-anti-sigma factor
MSGSAKYEASIIDGDILAVILQGDLDSVTTEGFNRLIQQHLDAGMTRIIIDCRWLGYISSTGIGFLIVLQTRLRRKGGAVKLCAIQGPVMSILRTVRLDKVLDIYGDLEFARQSFHAGETPLASLPT